MNRQLTATEAKTKFLALLDEVENGEVIEITRYGRTIARLGPARGPHALLGMHDGLVRQLATDEELYSTGEPWEIESE